MMIRAFVLLCFVALAPVSGWAQTFPTPQNLFVNDYADLISADDEAILQSALQTLKRDKGIEATVLTVQSWRALGGSHPTLESFSTALFNHWGIGHADRNDGILVLIARSEQEMRVELGTGFPESYDRRVESIIEQSFLPAFRADAYSRGIRQGVSSLVIDIATPFSEGAEVPRGSDDQAFDLSSFFFVIPLSIFAAFVAAMKILPNYLRRCPSCKTRSTLHRESRTIQHATTTMEGTREVHEHCSHCGYESDYSENIPLRTQSRSGSASFGGGSSKGGGASGRW